MTEKPIGNREKNKATNRRKILEAARGLVLEGGSDALSMRTLADRAEVSSRTPYNLFGSKTAVLLAMLDAPLAEIQKGIPAVTENVLLTSLEVIETHFAIHAPLVDYYRQIYGGIMSSDQHEARASVLQATKRFILPILLRAQKNGELTTSNLNAIADYLVTMIAGLLGLWASGLLTEQQLITDYKRSVGLCFLSVCSDKARKQIEGHVPDFKHP